MLEIYPHYRKQEMERAFLSAVTTPIRDKNFN